MPDIPSWIAPDRHVLLAGPTASGKSGLALRLAETQGGIIVNADAQQVWSCWRVISARPDAADLARAPHRLYGHMAPGADYSVGAWLEQVRAILAEGQRLIIVGGTGLYLHALANGLAVIAPVPGEVRRAGDALLAGEDGLARMIAQIDAATRAGIDLQNPARVQRAWEVFVATGRGLADWQAHTPAPLIAPQDATRIVMTSDRDWLSLRIERRFHQMMAEGALDEVRAMRPIWAPRALWAHAIGAPDLMAHLEGKASLQEAVARAIITTRQYAKAQRSFFRGRMRDWQALRSDAAA